MDEATKLELIHEYFKQQESTKKIKRVQAIFDLEVLSNSEELTEIEKLRLRYLRFILWDETNTYYLDDPERRDCILFYNKEKKKFHLRFSDGQVLAGIGGRIDAFRIHRRKKSKEPFGTFRGFDYFSINAKEAWPLIAWLINEDKILD